MKIQEGTSATVQYRLQDADTGEVIDQSAEKQPLTLIFGKGLLFPEFEENLQGLSVGDPFDFVIKAADAYGDIDPYAVFDIPLDTFEVDGKIDEQMIQIGNRITMTDDMGGKHLGKILKISEDAVLMDFNHPLAGKNIRFTGKVIEIKQ